jgi:membrane protein DedA with SNARE-associated domain
LRRASAPARHRNRPTAPPDRTCPTPHLPNTAPPEGDRSPVSAPAQLPGFLQALAPLLDHWGYAAVALLLFLEDFGVPVPGETVLIAASVYAGAGRLNIVAVGVIAFVAAVLGDNTGYAIGRFGGRALVLRYGRYVLITEERLAKAEGFFHRHGGKIITVARFIEGLRQANGIIAGLSGMPWLRFLAFNALGATLWVATWTAVGYLAGDHITTIYDAVSRYSLYLLGAAVVLIILFVIRRRRRSRRSRTHERATGSRFED